MSLNTLDARTGAAKSFIIIRVLDVLFGYSEYSISFSFTHNGVSLRFLHRKSRQIADRSLILYTENKNIFIYGSAKNIEIVQRKFNSSKS